MWRWLVKMARRSFKSVTDLETNFEFASQNHAVSEKQLILNGQLALFVKKIWKINLFLC